MSKLAALLMKYSYNDIMVKPAILSTIEHRAECNPYYSDGMLPLFTAPMDSVVGIDNFELFEKNHIIPILPRTENLYDRISYSMNGKWAAFSLQEFEETFTTSPIADKHDIKALIDIANGHVERLYKSVREAKRLYGKDIKIMVGNIANPETYRICVESHVDYVRCSVGTGAGCITCSNTAIGYPIASLISEIASIKNEYVERGVDVDNLPKIVADGGIRNYSDIIKALALGADYVMCGSIFSRMLESSADKYCVSFPISEISNIHMENGLWHGDYKNDKNVYIGDINARFYGMASRAGQIAMKGKKVHTSEGIEKILPVTYTMSTWVENMTDYLRSAMSYTNSRTLEELKQVELVIVSMNTYNSINK